MATQTFTEITQLKSMGEVFGYIKEKYPSWMVDMLDKYCFDYPHLNENWTNLSNKYKVPKQKIILVSGFQHEDHFMIAELLTTAGFIVRTTTEFIPCSVCSSAIPSRVVYNKFIEEDPDRIVPLEWSNKCSTC